MKKIFRFLAIALVAATSLVACQEDEGLQSDAQPVVKYIRSTDPTLAEVYLTEASMGEMLAIIGEGLEGVCDIRFNDVAAKLNPTMITDNSIIVQVPSTLPTEITNTITLTTYKGKKCVVENFICLAPAPVVTSVSCEWAKPGDEVTIYGNYFFNKADGSPIDITIGGVEAELVSVAPTEVVAVVPAIDTAAKQRILAINDNGTGRSSFYLYDTADVYMDFDNLSWDWWNYSSDNIASDNGISGDYMLMSATSKAWNWDDKNLAAFFCNLNEDGSVGRELIDADAAIEDYVLKFEIRKDAWSDLDMAMWFTDQYNTFSIDGTEAQCHWSGFKAGLPEGEWTTVTIPLTDFNTNKEENETRKLSASQMKNFCIFFFGSLENDANSGAPLQIAIDNFRVVHK